jgi:hypothetical protein
MTNVSMHWNQQQAAGVVICGTPKKATDCLSENNWQWASSKRKLT